MPAPWSLCLRTWTCVVRRAILFLLVVAVAEWSRAEATGAGAFLGSTAGAGTDAAQRQPQSKEATDSVAGRRLSVVTQHNQYVLGNITYSLVAITNGADRSGRGQTPLDPYANTTDSAAGEYVKPLYNRFTRLRYECGYKRAGVLGYIELSGVWTWAFGGYLTPSGTITKLEDNVVWDPRLPGWATGDNQYGWSNLIDGVHWGNFGVGGFQQVDGNAPWRDYSFTCNPQSSAYGDNATTWAPSPFPNDVGFVRLWLGAPTQVWTRIAKCVGETSTNRRDYSPAVIQWLAQKASQVRICTTGVYEDCVTSFAGTFPIQMLRLGRTISYNVSATCDTTCVASTWIGAETSIMWNTCNNGPGAAATGALTGPTYFVSSCNNAHGLHMQLSDGGTCRSDLTTGAGQNLEVFVNVPPPVVTEHNQYIQNGTTYSLVAITNGQHTYGAGATPANQYANTTDAALGEYVKKLPGNFTRLRYECGYKYAGVLGYIELSGVWTWAVSGVLTAMGTITKVEDNVVWDPQLPGWAGDSLSRYPWTNLVDNVHWNNFGTEGFLEVDGKSYTAEFFTCNPQSNAYGTDPNTWAPSPVPGDIGFVRLWLGAPTPAPPSTFLEPAADPYYVQYTLVAITNGAITDPAANQFADSSDPTVGEYVRPLYKEFTRLRYECGYQKAGVLGYIELSGSWKWEMGGYLTALTNATNIGDNARFDPQLPGYTGDSSQPWTNVKPGAPPANFGTGGFMQVDGKQWTMSGSRANSFACDPQITQIVKVESVNFPGYFLGATAQGVQATVASANYWDFQMVPGLANSSAISLQSATWPTYYLQDVGGVIVLQEAANSSSTTKANATFWLRAALNGGSGVSFESFAVAGRFFYHYNFLVTMDRKASSFQDDASFNIRYKMAETVRFEATNWAGYFITSIAQGVQGKIVTSGLWDFQMVTGLASPLGISLQSVMWPTYYLQEIGGSLVTQAADGTSTSKAAATFYLRPALNGRAGAVSFESFATAGKWIYHGNFFLWVSPRQAGSGADDNGSFFTRYQNPDNNGGSVWAPSPTPGDVKFVRLWLGQLIITTTTTTVTSSSTTRTMSTTTTATPTTTTTSTTTFIESIATMVTGNMSLYTASPDAFVNNTNVTIAMTVMLANFVRTDSIFVRMRLAKVLSPTGGRRLQSANVNLGYSILVPAAASSSPSVDSLVGTLSTVQVSTLQTAATVALNNYTRGRFAVTVTGVGAPTVVLPTTTTQTITATITKFVTVTKTTTTTSTRTSTTVTSTTRTTTTAAPGAPTQTSTTITVTTSTTTITAPPPPAAVSAPAAPCTDSATYRDAKGLTCQDWKGLNCSSAPGYTEKILAGIRKKCAAACGTCTVAAPFVVQEVKKVSSELALAVDLTHLDQDTRVTAMKACVSAALGVPMSNVVGLNVTVVNSRRLQGGTPQYKVKYEVVVPPSLQVRDIMLQATSLSAPGSDSLATFSQVMSDGFGVDTSTLAVEVTSRPVAEAVSVVLDGDTVVGTTAPAPAPGGPAPASSGSSVVVDNCADEGQFLDEQGEGCSSWVGLDCASTKWLRSERPYTLKGLRQVLTSCPLSCGKCSPPSRMTFDQLRDQCIDDPLVAGWCARWRNLNCSSAADLGYSSSYAALLLDRCPQSCGMCPASAVACVDAPGFLDEQGAPCESWKGFSCTKEYSGYTRKGMLEVQAACPASCGFCGAQAGRSLAFEQQPEQCTDKPDYTYLQQFTCRDFVGRTCTYGTLYLEPRWLLGPHAVSAWHQNLWNSCPVSCTRCNPQGRPTPQDLLIECEDDQYFAEWCSVKWKGQDCSKWEGSVRLVVNGEAPKYNATLLGRCPETCGLCKKPTCGDGTYRNKVAHTCSPCQLGRYAKGVRSGADAECRPAEPGFSVPEEGSTQQYPCERGQFTNISGQAECSNCTPGYYSASRGMSSCVPCEAGWFQDQPGATECLRCEEGTYAPSNATARCEHCPFDYTTLLQASTAIDACVCPAGTYKPYNTTGGCRVCPIAIDCPGGHQFVNDSWDNTPMLMEGVMSLPEDPFSAYTCTASDACQDERPLPFSEDTMMLVCPDLTWGPRCWNCPDNGTGAFHDDDGNCQPCDQMGRRAVGVTGFFVLQFAGTWWAYRSEGTVQTGAKIMFMAGIGFLQVLATLVQMPLKWPWDLTWVLTFLNWFNYDGFLSDIFQFREECFFAPTLLARVLRDVFLPLLPFINFGIIGAFYYLIKREMVWTMAKNVMAGMWLGFFVNLSVMALQMFPAEQMPNGKLYLIAYPGVEVGSREWKEGVPVSLVAIAVYCCTFLTYAFHAVIMAPSKQEDEEWLESRDFMLGETDPTCFWWCLVDLFYAFCIALVQALSPNVYFSLYLSLAVLLGYIGMIIYYQPCIYKQANHVNMMLNVGMFIFTALSMGLIDVTLVDQSENRAGFGTILITLLIILLVWIVLRIAYALYTRCAVNQLELNVEEAHRARIVLQSLLLLPEQEFIQSLGDVWDPEVHTWTQCNQMLIPVFLKQQPSTRFLLQRAMPANEFKVFHHDECRIQAFSNNRKGEVAQRLEENCNLTMLTHTVATQVLRPIGWNTKVEDGVVKAPGPIISHAAKRIESHRLTQSVLVQVLPEVPATYMNPKKGDPEATTSLASKALVKLLTHLETGRSEFGKRVALKLRSVLHECGATLVDEDAFVEELLDLVDTPEHELREVYRHLDVNRRGQLKASHIVTQLKLLGDIPRDYYEAEAEAEAEHSEVCQGHGEHADHGAESHDMEGHSSHFKKGHGKGKYGHHHVHHHHLSGEHHEDREESHEGAAHSAAADMVTLVIEDKEADARSAAHSFDDEEVDLDLGRVRRLIV